MYLVTAEQMRQLDSETIQQLGIPAIALMENAGRVIAEEIIALCRERGGAGCRDAAEGNDAGLKQAALGDPGKAFKVSADHALTLASAAAERWFILVGKGNNGGDGLAAARYLRETGIAVTLVYAVPPESL
ncbi:NAD(P)H-hydrate epimerase, partial [Paenibacillus odorifer]|uniref:NAD(P)H-hydrate epimerase n=2 Tax=Paenibacillus TaxID=44249 RepID=UPI00289B3B7A